MIMLRHYKKLFNKQKQEEYEINQANKQQKSIAQ